MNAAPLLVGREGRVLHLTLNRPAKCNALSAELCTALVDALDGAADDAGVGAILLDAAGDVYCAGMDLDEATQADAAERTEVHQRLFTAGARAAKPIVGAVNGPALGGGLGLAANAHVLIAAQGSTFGLTEIRLGMWPFVIFPAMVAAVGERRATELALTGRIFGVPDALNWGLVHEAVPRIELEDRAMAVAENIAAASPLAVGKGLAYLRRRRGMNFEETLALGAALRAELFGGGDWQEGVAALRERRRPEWPSLGRR
jgi:enoyl-CoA hydratase/carnithine racemase